MALADHVAARIEGDSGHLDIEPSWERQVEMVAPAVGLAWISLVKICVRY